MKMRSFYRVLVMGALFAVGCGGMGPTSPDAGPQAQPQGEQPAAMGMGTAGEFVGAAGHSASGGVTLSIEDGNGRIDFGSDFTVDAVPGPVVYVNTTNNPHTGMPLQVAPLRRNSGSQSYGFVASPGVRYTWVLVWCETFDVPVAEAPIAPTP